MKCEGTGKECGKNDAKRANILRKTYFLYTGVYIA
jgi:hypothetical protein